ncbi:MULTISPECIES: hypothetical protein [Rhizobium]|jgi:hypothetical protein|uniref:hypothetical protein n=1 Tax=Rhizobium TaxID=379 RepID=UPI00102FB251|nr:MULTISPECIES: hypothetical protein [Rhizobium]TAZ29779.1 hypothetical protein ELH73_07875 [Rhizobium leguminosarum]TBC57107.1 hypothetical protein ELH32_08310 [Rhizobium ruizarguesonis]
MTHSIIKGLSATLSLLGCFVAAGCQTIDFDKLPSGKFSGTLIVMWVGEGGKAGDGKFVFVPDPHNRLSFTRAESSAAPIIPGVMYTDGGSVPKVVQPFRGFNPWGYAPAYMIHDWIFTAHHCISDGKQDPAYLAMAKIDFHESGVILGEAIQTLMAKKLVEENDISKFAITTAVLSPVARNLWDAEGGACDAGAVKPEHLREIELAVPGSTTDEARRRHIDVEASVRTIRRPSNAVVVGRVSFDRQP